MRTHTTFLNKSLLILSVIGLALSEQVLALANPWEKVLNPAPGPIKIIGSYSSGCIRGATSLLPDETNFEIMRQERRRYFAHPRLRQFIIWLSDAIQEHGYGKLLVGDLSQARGGPTTKGHASHQNGLDVDLWYWLNSPAVKHPLSSNEKESLSSPSVLNATHTGVNKAKFTEANIQVLKLAATYPDVERIFVNPHIKRLVCNRTGNAAWLRKVRPWWGHDDHLHVRLSCPPDQPECAVQESIEDTDGCGSELDGWLGPKAAEEARKNSEKDRNLTPEQRLAKKLMKVPKSCELVLHAD